MCLTPRQTCNLSHYLAQSLFGHQSPYYQCHCRVSTMFSSTSSGRSFHGLFLGNRLVVPMVRSLASLRSCTQPASKTQLIYSYVTIVPLLGYLRRAGASSYNPICELRDCQIKSIRVVRITAQYHVRIC